MANLLPQYMKRRIRKEYLERIITAWLFALAGGLTVTIILLIPAYVLLYSKLSNLNQNVSGGVATAVVEGSADIIQTTRAYVTLLQQDTAYRKVPYGIFVHLFEIKTNSITLSRMSYSGASNKIGISGTAATRNDLKNFIDVFNDDSMFASIDNYPYESLSYSEDILFTFDITMKDSIKE